MDLKIFSGEANEPFARNVVGCIASHKLGPMHFHKFSDGEFKIRFEESIRGQEELFIIQSTNPPMENFFELLLMIDAAKRASVHRMYIVIPYLVGMRQDKKEKSREPLTARLVADLIDCAAGKVPYHVITADMHSEQQEGYFESITPLQAMPVAVNYFKEHLSLDNLAIAAPDTNATKRAREVAERLGCPLIIIDKRRPRENESEVVEVIGDPSGKVVLFWDDMLDTAGTIEGGVKAVFERGAIDSYAFCTHGVLSGPAIERIRKSSIKKVFVTDTIYQDPRKLAAAGKGKIEIISLAPLFADAVMRIYRDQSVSELFE